MEYPAGNISLDEARQSEDKPTREIEGVSEGRQEKQPDAGGYGKQARPHIRSHDV